MFNNTVGTVACDWKSSLNGVLFHNLISPLLDLNFSFDGKDISNTGDRVWVFFQIPRYTLFWINLSVFVYIGKMLKRIWFFTSQLVWYNLGLKLFSGWTIATQWFEADREIRKILILRILVWLFFSRYRRSGRFTVRWYIAIWWCNLKR